MGGREERGEVRKGEVKRIIGRLVERGRGRTQERIQTIKEREVNKVK